MNFSPIVKLRISESSLLFLLSVSVSFSAWAETPPWPEPLTLEFALGLASDEHPKLQIATAEIEQAKAQQLQIEAETGFEATLSAQLRWVDPPAIAYDQSSDDHRLSLLLNKPLYDFGRTTAKKEASQSYLNSREYAYKDSLSRHRIAIMAAFFDVLLADQAYARDTEEMAMTYVRSDRAKYRNEMGQLSDIELMEKRSEFQASRLRQAQSAAAQRTSRAHLANLLNYPGQLPSELLEPQLDFATRQIPEEIDAWFSALEQGSPEMLALAAQRDTARAQLGLAKSDDNPVLRGQVEVAEYSREMGSNDRWRAGVVLDVPLLDGGRSGALQAERRAELHRLEASMEQQRRELQQQVLELWNELKTLKVAEQRLVAERAYRDLYLDRSRALYELEVASDLGDSMVRMSALRYRVMKMKFSTALAWARLDALLGQEGTMEQ